MNHSSISHEDSPPASYVRPTARAVQMQKEAIMRETPKEILSLRERIKRFVGMLLAPIP